MRNLFEENPKLAIGLITLQFNSAPVRALVESRLSGPRLAELGDRERSGSARFRAIPFYQAALRRLSSGHRAWRATAPDLNYDGRQMEMRRIEEKLAGLFVELADALAKGAKPMLIVHSAEEVCREADSQISHQPFQAPIWRKLLELQTARLAEISKPALAGSLDRLAGKEGLPHDEHNRLNGSLREAGNLASDILRVAGPRLWGSLVKDTNFNPWPLLPADVQAEFAARRKKGDKEEYLRDLLATRPSGPDYQTPLSELRPVRQILCKINARRGLIIYSVQPDEFASWTRGALAENTDPQLRASIYAAATKAMLSCREPAKFNTFYSLTGFFVSDLGLENLTPSQRKEFKSALAEAATGLASTERAKAIFLWTIQAEAYAGEPDGAKAKDAAVQGAFNLVAAMTPQKIGAESLAPSGLKELSVLSVENSTEHHLLVFYRGPETVILASRPWRKSSAVLKDGRYEIAVIAPSGALQPYRGEITLQSAWRKSVYHVATSDSRKQESAVKTCQRSVGRVPTGPPAATRWQIHGGCEDRRGILGAVGPGF